MRAEIDDRDAARAVEAIFGRWNSLLFSFSNTSAHPCGWEKSPG
jgi:hypothetical protein